MQQIDHLRQFLDVSGGKISIAHATLCSAKHGDQRNEKHRRAIMPRVEVSGITRTSRRIVIRTSTNGLPDQETVPRILFCILNAIPLYSYAIPLCLSGEDCHQHEASGEPDMFKKRVGCREPLIAFPRFYFADPCGNIRRAPAERRASTIASSRRVVPNPCSLAIPVRLSWKCTRFVISLRWPRS